MYTRQWFCGKWCYYHAWFKFMVCCFVVTFMLPQMNSCNSEPAPPDWTSTSPIIAMACTAMVTYKIPLINTCLCWLVIYSHVVLVKYVFSQITACNNGQKKAGKDYGSENEKKKGVEKREEVKEKRLEIGSNFSQGCNPWLKYESTRNHLSYWSEGCHLPSIV